MRIVAWIVAAMLVALAGVSVGGISASIRGLDRVPAGRQRAARLILLAGIAGVLARFIVAIALLLATYDPSGRWKVPVIVLLGLALAAAVPGIGIYLWRHHEPWMQRWRGAVGRKPTTST